MAHGGINVFNKWFGKGENLEIEELYSKIDSTRIPLHVAIIMDGNGRWAKKRGMPRFFGHRAGVDALKNIVKTSSQIGIKVLTAYAFSTENWKRPVDEVNFLMNLLDEYIDAEIDELDYNKVKLRFIGKIDDLALSLQKKIKAAEERTEKNTGLILNLAVNYGGRAELAKAMRHIAENVEAGKISAKDVSEETIPAYLYTEDLPDPDLLIRPSGDFRISNFLLWQLAYTEFWFSDINWPDFKPKHLLEAILTFQCRDRRFGGLK